MAKGTVTLNVSDYPKWLRKEEETSICPPVLVPPFLKLGGRSKIRESTVIMGNLEPDPQVLKGYRELLRQRRRVEIANNKSRFRRRWNREPTQEESWTGRPGPIGAR